MAINDDKSKSVGFISNSLPIKTGICQLSLQKSIYSLLQDFYLKGYRNFLTPAREGFCLLAAEAVLMLKEKLQDTDIKLILVFSPHAEQEKIATVYYKQMLEAISGKCEWVDALAGADDFIFGHSSVVVALPVETAQGYGKADLVRQAQTAGAALIDIQDCKKNKKIKVG